MPNTRQDKSVPLSERLKSFFRVGKTTGFPHPSSYELQLKPELVEELSSSQTTPVRLKVLKELGAQVCVFVTSLQHLLRCQNIQFNYCR